MIFADAARKLAGAAGRLLGWTPGTFWAATPAELAAILFPETDPEAGEGISRAQLDAMMERESDGR